jgi:hypothetical protein
VNHNFVTGDSPQKNKNGAHCFQWPQKEHVDAAKGLLAFGKLPKK